MYKSMLNVLCESRAGFGASISFIDIDETTFNTFAKIKVFKGKNLIHTLNNQEFNTYSLQPDEKFNFDQFRDSKLFNATSRPINKTIKRIKNMIRSIKRFGTEDKVIFLTARSDFDNKEVFLDTFRSVGIDVDIPNVHVERSGNLIDIPTVSARKTKIISHYLSSGKFSIVRMYDDDKKNLTDFKDLGEKINNGYLHILEKVQNKNPNVQRIHFYPLLVNERGTAHLYNI